MTNHAKRREPGETAASRILLGISRASCTAISNTSIA
jgi:hypothetical protein